MPLLLRTLLGDSLRRERLHQRRTLRDVSATARVSLGYLSEVERGQKEASSELLASICSALDVRLADVLREVSDDLAVVEPLSARAGAPHRRGRAGRCRYGARGRPRRLTACWGGPAAREWQSARRERADDRTHP